MVGGVSGFVGTCVMGPRYDIFGIYRKKEEKYLKKLSKAEHEILEKKQISKDELKKKMMAFEGINDNQGNDLNEHQEIEKSN